MGGGGNDFLGWTIPQQLATTPNGSYQATVAAAQVTLNGTGNEVGNDGTDSVRVTMVVGPNAITSTTIVN